MTRGEYQDYLQSRHWRRFRLSYQQKREWRCWMCHATDRLELHHKTYERLGAERLSDVTPLCQECHAAVHRMNSEYGLGLDPAKLFPKRYSGERLHKPEPVQHVPPQRFGRALDPEAAQAKREKRQRETAAKREGALARRLSAAVGRYERSQRAA